VEKLALKPCPHQEQCRSNVVECYKSNDSFYRSTCNIRQRCFDIVVGVDVALDWAAHERTTVV